MDYYHRTYAMNQYLAARGFVVLSVNFRGGTGYGRDFRLPSGLPREEAAYQDILAAARFLRGRPDVDPARLGIWGGSYGGYLTATNSAGSTLTLQLPPRADAPAPPSRGPLPRGAPP